MSDKSFILPILSGVISSAITFALSRFIPSLYGRFQKWGKKKTANLVSGLGLILTSVPMIILSTTADAQMYSFTGFIIPFIHPSIQGLTFDQASIFGNFANFFAATLIIGGFGSILGAARIQKFHNLRSPPFRVGY